MSTTPGLQPESHSYIKDIVQQVRSGKKNKAEAFSQLKEILQAGNVARDAASSGDVDGPALSEDERSTLMSRIADQQRSENIDPTNASTMDGDSTIFSSADGSGKHGEAWEPIEYKNSSRSHAFAPREQASMDVRAQRIAQAESVIRGEMFKECTFQPKIKALPQHYNSSQDILTTPFYDRVTKWQKEKEIEGARRKELVDESLTMDCTFHPRINPNSDRAVKQIRGGEGFESASDRLYKSNETAQYQRSKFIEDELRKEKLEEDQACTFRPTMSTHKKKFAYVKSKFDQPLFKDRQAFQDNLDDPLKDCTFTPKVKGVRHNMPSAKLYVNTNVVDRLTRPVTAPSAHDDSARFDSIGDGSVMDVASFMGSLANGGARSNYTTPGRPRSARSTSAPRERAGDAPVSSEEKAARRQAFKEFLGRQSQTKVKKDTKMKEVIKETTPNFTPRLCKKSLEMTEKSFSGDFISRVERDVGRRADQATKREAWREPEASFKPTINARSNKLVSRSVTEMSKGDMLKKAANYRMMKAKTEQENMAEHTFRPTISKRAQSAGRGKVKLSTDPTAVVEQYEATQRQREQLREQYLLEKEAEEMAQCTFHPRTKKCPQYVTNIAKSMEIVRNARVAEASTKASKPEWK